MIARFVTLLAILAITVVTTAASAHAARMGLSRGPDHAAHVGAHALAHAGAHPGEMMHAPELAPPACDGEQPCGQADAEICEFVCAGLAAFLTSPGADAGRAPQAARHDFASEPIHVSRAPGLTERPPKLRLL